MSESRVINHSRMDFRITLPIDIPKRNNFSIHDFGIIQVYKAFHREVMETKPLPCYQYWNCFGLICHNNCEYNSVAAIVPSKEVWIKTLSGIK